MSNTKSNKTLLSFQPTESIMNLDFNLCLSYGSGSAQDNPNRIHSSSFLPSFSGISEQRSQDSANSSTTSYYLNSGTSSTCHWTTNDGPTTSLGISSDQSQKSSASNSKMCSTKLFLPHDYQQDVTQGTSPYAHHTLMNSKWQDYFMANLSNPISTSFQPQDCYHVSSLLTGSKGKVLSDRLTSLYGLSTTNYFDGLLDQHQIATLDQKRYFQRTTSPLFDSRQFMHPNSYDNGNYFHEVFSSKAPVMHGK